MVYSFKSFFLLLLTDFHQYFNLISSVFALFYLRDNQLRDENVAHNDDRCTMG